MKSSFFAEAFGQFAASVRGGWGLARRGFIAFIATALFGSVLFAAAAVAYPVAAQGQEGQPPSTETVEPEETADETEEPAGGTEVPEPTTETVEPDEAGGEPEPTTQRQSAGITFTAPVGLLVGRNLTREIDASSYITITTSVTISSCGDATGITATQLSSVSHTAGSCTYTIDPVDTYEGTASFTIPYTFSDSTTHNGSVSIVVGPESSIVGSPPSNWPIWGGIGSPSTVKLDIEHFASDGDYEISCTSVTATTGTISNRATNSCTFDYARAGNRGTINVNYSSAGGSTLRVGIGIDLTNGPFLRSHNFPAQTVAQGGRITIQAENHISLFQTGTHVCFDPTSIDSKISVIRRGCRYIITGITQGRSSFTLNFGVTSAELRSPKINVTVGGPSTLAFTPPTGLRVGRNTTQTISALNYITEDPAYTVSCGNATGVDTAKITSVSRSGCVFTVDPINTLTPAQQGDTTFSVLFTSTGGTTTTGTFTINIGPDSNLTFSGPELLSELAVRGGQRTRIDASVYASDGDYGIQCTSFTPPTSGNPVIIDSSVGCIVDFTANVFGLGRPRTHFIVNYRSTSGATLNAREIWVRGNLGTSSLTYTAPTNLIIPPGGSSRIDASLYVRETTSAYRIFCLSYSHAHSDLIISQDGCTFTIRPTASATAGNKSFRINYSSSGGSTRTGTVTIAIGPTSDITFTAPTDLTVGKNRTKTINALDYVTDTDTRYRISCGDATAIDTTELMSVTRSGCNFTITPKNVQGAASFTVPYTSTGGGTHSGVIPITVGPDSTITFTAPPATAQADCRWAPTAPALLMSLPMPPTAATPSPAGMSPP